MKARFHLYEEGMRITYEFSEPWCWEQIQHANPTLTQILDLLDHISNPANAITHVPCVKPYTQPQRNAVYLIPKDQIISAIIEVYEEQGGDK